MLPEDSRFHKTQLDVALVRRLVAEQFPQWADLTIKPVERQGWDNRTFHLGEHMTARLPSAAAYAPQAEKEHRWLPRLAPLLPLPIPVALAVGAPAEGYPWPWSIYPWLEGEVASLARIADLQKFAITLARFLVDLQKIDATDGPPPAPHNFFRGGPLATYDQETRKAIVDLDGKIDATAATAVWEEALSTTWSGSPVWLHGDISSGNLLIKNGELSAVIDFGCVAVGDPACDLAITWTLFFGESRSTFYKELSVDQSTWARGRGWALWKALITLAYHTNDNPQKAAKAQRTLDAVLTVDG